MTYRGGAVDFNSYDRESPLPLCWSRLYLILYCSIIILENQILFFIVVVFGYRDELKWKAWREIHLRNNGEAYFREANLE